MKKNTENTENGEGNNLQLEKARGMAREHPNNPTTRAAINAVLTGKAEQSTDEMDKDANSQVIEAAMPKLISPKQKEKLLSKLEVRFNDNQIRHKGIEWAKVQRRLNEASPEKLWSLNEMQRTSGKPDVVGFVEETGEYEFWDFSKESPEGRRNLCYDREGQKKAERIGESPAGNVVDMVAAMGLGGVLSGEQTRDKLQKLGKFDPNTYSWIDTHVAHRNLGVAFGADRMGDNFYEFGKQTHEHYEWMGFRGWLKI